MCVLLRDTIVKWWLAVDTIAIQVLIVVGGRQLLLSVGLYRLQVDNRILRIVFLNNLRLFLVELLDIREIKLSDNRRLWWFLDLELSLKVFQLPHHFPFVLLQTLFLYLRYAFFLDFEFHYWLIVLLKFFLKLQLWLLKVSDPILEKFDHADFFVTTFSWLRGSSLMFMGL